MKVIKDIIARIKKHDIKKSAAQISYYNVIAFLTISAVIVYIAKFFPEFINKVLENLESILPSVIKGVFDNAVNEVNVPQNITVLLFTTFTTIFFASRSFQGIMEAFDNIYEIDQSRKLIRAKAVSIFFTLSMFVMIVAMFYISVMGETFADNLFQNLQFLKVFNMFRAYGTIIILIIIMTLMYVYLPNMKIKVKHAIPGALFTSIIWLALSRFFSFYVSNITSFSWVLGSFGSIFAFMIWIFWLSIIVLIGAEINSFIINRHDKKSIQK